ncbi:hypothetical protein GCM10016455_14570 [Aliiroseovarius zhejiangensis]|uniref:Glycosyltransferase n=1 Tax=Aliiroseovarius zhejiangensis TaxID=1632025 RepID=A0ABQ3IXT3_9RHOB|nr:CDP-glycerol glycerophosphotransferase family protein [Aliiroseovarius zhejiangensis]GHE95108.1 hypothetical protein GCM10016455_14570 [Aliiroseovarius zhejiangensis]
MKRPRSLEDIRSLTRLEVLEKIGARLRLKPLSQLKSRVRFRRYASAWNVPVDEKYYARHNRDALVGGGSGHEHFNTIGYRELRNPRADFDIWWYTQNYLLGTADQDANPLWHYNKVGQARGHLARPPQKVEFRPEFSKPLVPSPRRICLFAGTDPDGRVDDTVVTYLREVSRHADVFFLADGPTVDTELAKLDGVVEQAWARRHGMFEFGAYSILARELVGWNRIETYDELILAHDGCYLVHSLKDTLDAMAEKPCAWWGLVAGKGFIPDTPRDGTPYDTPIPLPDIKAQHLTAYEADDIYDFHVGAGMLGLRSAILRDPKFRRVLDHVTREDDPRLRARKYDIGLTRFLIGHGYAFETLVEDVAADLPTLTTKAFTLIDGGFPLLDCALLGANPFRQPGLHHWKARIARANPDLDTNAIERDLLRRSDAGRLHAAFRVAKTPGLSPAPRSAAGMFYEDRITPKYDHWWAFPVCAYSHQFSDNTRAVFERVKNDPSIKKIVLTRSVPIEAEGVNVVVAPLDSHEGQTYLLRARQVFLRHGVQSNIGYPLSGDLHKFHNLWHGIPLKRIGYTSLDTQHALDDVARENGRLTSVIASSDVDRLAMTAAYWPLSYHDIWVTGLPRHDYILTDETLLPPDFQPRLDHLRKTLNGRKFVLFAPTFRADQETGYYRFSEQEVSDLTQWLTRHGMVMGVREHMADQARLYSSQLQGDCFFDASERHFPDIELLYREADILLTDYSSCFIDFMLTGRPVISFAFDMEHYEQNERGLYYDMKLVFPGPICTDFKGLMQALEGSVRPISDLDRAAYDWKVNFFHRFRDADSSKRVVDRVRDTYAGSKLLWASRPGQTTPDRTVTFVTASDPAGGTTSHRLLALLDPLRKQGWRCTVVQDEQLRPKHLRQTRTLVLCGGQMTENLLDLCETFKAHGGKVIFDLANATHDFGAVSETDLFLGDPDASGDFLIQAERTQSMIETADYVTVSTPGLARMLEQVGTSGTVVPSVLTPDDMSHPTDLPAISRDDGVIRLCLIPDRFTPLADFSLCRVAVSELLTHHPSLELHLIGGPDIDAFGMAGHRDQVRRHPEPNGADLHHLLGRMDINLTPVAPLAFSRSRDDTRLIITAQHRIPTILSPSHPFADVVDDQKTAILAQTKEDWTRSIGTLISDPDLRHRIGVAAFQDLLPLFAASRSAKILAEVMDAAHRNG